MLHPQDRPHLLASPSLPGTQPLPHAQPPPSTPICKPNPTHPPSSSPTLTCQQSSTHTLSSAHRGSLVCMSGSTSHPNHTHPYKP